MDLKRIGLFELAERRLAWADRRQAVLAENVANANTPGYKPHDLRSFAATLDNTNVVAPVRTQPNHLAGTTAAMSPDEVVDRTHTQSPDGNAIALDEQLVKVAETETTHTLVTTIYKKYLGMFSMALGRSASEFQQHYDPSNPAANAEGYVKLPNINSLVEVMDMREAERSYSANLAVMQASRSMLTRTIALLQ